MLEQLSPHLYRYRDTCNVYLVVSGNAALAIDFGSGEILDELPGIGVDELEWVLHTHHHRDQCQGDWRLADTGTRIAVPRREISFLNYAGSFWRHKRTVSNYEMQSEFQTLAESLPAHARLPDFEYFRWREYSFEILPSPGHTKGSISLLAEIDGRRVAFCGDLIAAPGKVHRIHDLQWGYNELDGINAAAVSLRTLARGRPDQLLPSHGEAMDDPAEAIVQLRTNLTQLYNVAKHTPEVPRTPQISTGQYMRPISEHVWANRNSESNFYALVSDSGRALLLDYGFPSTDHGFPLSRFGDHSLQQLRDAAGVEKIDAVIPSHYHDDHVAGIPFLQERWGVEVWAHRVFAPIIADPLRYNLPCLMREPIRVDRVLENGEEFEWEGYRLQAFHAPGHTHYASQVFFSADNIRYALTGDNILGSQTGPRLGGPIYRNRYNVGSFRPTLRALSEYSPQLLLTGHSGALSVDHEQLDELMGKTIDLERAFKDLVVDPDEVNFALDPQFFFVRPYWAFAAAGEEVELEVHLTNHCAHAAEFHIRPNPPAGWSFRPEQIKGSLREGESVRLQLRLRVAADAAPARRRVATYDLTLGGRRFGQEAESLISVFDDD